MDEHWSLDPTEPMSYYVGGNILQGDNVAGTARDITFVQNDPNDFLADDVTFTATSTFGVGGFDALSSSLPTTGIIYNFN